MKKVISLLLILFMCFALSACNSSQNAETTETTGYTVSEESNAAKEESSSTQQDENGDTETMKVLVAYFSRTGENYGVGHIEKGNTHIIADMIAEQVDADLFEISTVVPYPDEYEACTETARQEQEEDARPERSATVESMEDYDVIFLGYPIWWSDMPMAVYTFLESYDFSGKTIIPFCTHEGSGLSSTDSSIAEICTGADVLDGLEIRGSVAQNSQDEALTAVTDWLDKIEILDEN